MEVIEGNKLIAEFMGILLDPLSNTKTSVHFGSKTLQYHTSWDWLMPVVEKIEKTGCDSRIMAFNDEGSYLCDFVDSENWERACVSNYNVPKIQVVWESVVQFIQWYNSINGGQNKKL